MSKRILILAGQEFEDVELLCPLYRFKEEDWEVHVASYTKDLVGKHGYRVRVDKLLEEVNPADYDALVLPGGRGPERLRLFAREKAVRIVKHFVETNKPIIAICHGPQLLISAGVVKGRKLTSYQGIRDDLVAAGAEWVDAEVVVDGNLVTARVPGDIPAWLREAVKLIKGE